MIQQKIDMEATGQAYRQARQAVRRRVIVCAGTGCVANGSLKVYEALRQETEARGLEVVVKLGDDCDCKGDVFVSKSGCQGFCQAGPLVTIEPEDWLYVHVKPEDVADIVEQTLIHDRPVKRLVYVDPASHEAFEQTHEIPFYKRQQRVVLAECGNIDPEDIREYIARGGYAAAKRAFKEMQPEQVCEEVLASGLRGRGGGGFPTGRKWALTLPEPGEKKFVICNGDEGDPGAFMDRSLMEGNPHRVLEGIMIAARAIGADEAYVYVRAEYPLAVQRIRKAVADAEEAGILGEDVFDSGRNMTCQVMEGAGAFVCGEETALMASIEGLRGMPRPKPPFPAQSGLWGKPTVINNVETLATVPLIIAEGSGHYRRLGTAGSPGTKTFAVTGHVANTGLIEVPFGTTLREIIFEIGGGVIDNLGQVMPDGFKAVQIGGPSGGCLIAEHLDMPLDFDSVKGIGAMVGSGGLVVMNRDTCMVKIAHFFMRFTQNESCGKCVPCREGTKQMLWLLEDIMEGRATAQTLELLEELASAVQLGSLCGLGKTAPNPVLSTLRYFRSEYEAHIVQKRCPAGQCKALATPEILADRCKGCGACLRKCPVNAITGEKKMPHRIDAGTCIKCGTCAQVCRFDAIVGVN
ncbi:NADH-ubiquinone oxidoreductase-F iron-sulfur binding region domain-containing protein [Anaerobaca lacustris]|uniref:NADH-ubiquinone oxidoreductase-F iron-sulfur binding region domain-containing protein n=1 Tax=Anaerobaca lacustris TaxID=3044600 RepID=A0AAW6U0Q0_9BACT|nr:NADH-ubiquinone oxidoreductase-F iron-sulfur binding region domain-containing protein [Sedimentisphaerales bacterium M17dextr]